MGSSKVAVAALDFIDEVSDLLDEAEIRDLLLQHAHRLGFSKLIVTELPQPSHRLQVYLCNWPPEFFRRYVAKYYADDPLARHARGTTEPFAWSEVHWDRSKGSREQRLIDIAAEYGLEDGFVVPVMGMDGEVSCIALSGARAHLTLEERRALHLMCVYAHHAVRNRRSARMAPQLPLPNLTAEQRSCAAYALGGYNLEEIAARMHLSASEAYALSRTTTRALRVKTLAEAATKAVMLKQIHP